MSNMILIPPRPILKPKPRYRTPIDPQEAVTYREPMCIERITQYGNGARFAICPRCNVPLDREYQAYCDRCGQCLDWRGASKCPVTKVRHP